MIRPMVALTVYSSREARDEVPAALARFRKEGARSKPVVIGAHRKAEAVVLPYALYEQLLPAIEDLEIAEIVRERTAAGPAESLAPLAASLGLDPADFS